MRSTQFFRKGERRQKQRPFEQRDRQTNAPNSAPTTDSASRPPRQPAINFRAVRAPKLQMRTLRQRSEPLSPGHEATVYDDAINLRQRLSITLPSSNTEIGKSNPSLFPHYLLAFSCLADDLFSVATRLDRSSRSRRTSTSELHQSTAPAQS